MQYNSDDGTIKSTKDLKARAREVVQSLNLIDDDFFQFVARDKDAVEV